MTGANSREYSSVTWFSVEVDQGVADDDRAAVGGAEQVGEVGVLPAAGCGGGGLSRDAGLIYRGRP